ncbi:MAG: MarR family transcriptional regulator, partial [Streptosporangiaceae bacterium]
MWLTREEEQAWIAAAAMIVLVPGALDAQLQRDAGLSLFEYLVLSWLSMTPGRALRMSELAEQANGSPSRLSNVARKLEARGWIRRYPDAEDGRCMWAALTESGYELVVAAAPGHVAAVRKY